MSTWTVNGWTGGDSSAVVKAQCWWPDTSHAGASLTRKQLHNWVPGRAPADVDLLPDLAMLIARSRDLTRNNGIAAGALQTSCDNVVGAGLRLASAPDWRQLGRDVKWAEEWTRNVESLWNAFADSCYIDAGDKLNFSSMTQLVWRSVLENGEALILPLWLGRNDTPYKTCFQMIEADRLSNPHWDTPTLNLRGGIAMDDYGAPVGYYIRKIQPGLSWYTPAWGLGGLGFGEWELIPAKTSWGRPRVLHIFAKERVEQTRGKPILAPVIEQFRMLDSYQRTELQSAIVNALVAGVIETPMDQGSIMDMIGQVGGNPGDYLAQKNQYRVQLEGGSIIPIWPGDKFTPFTPARPSGTFPSFVEAVMRQIGDAIGLPFELIAKDFSKVTYAAARASLGEAWRFFTNRRKWLADNWASVVYGMWLEEAVSLELVDAPNFYENRAAYSRCRWIGPGRSQIDPVKEAQASAIRMENQTSTLEIECAEAGLDWNEVLEQIALEKARKDELGILPPPPLKPPPGEEQPMSQEAA